jgi:hypothetical protein
VLRDRTATTEYVEPEAHGWANWMAIRFIESCVGYTATAADFVSACQAVAPRDRPLSPQVLVRAPLRPPLTTIKGMQSIPYGSSDGRNAMGIR